MAGSLAIDAGHNSGIGKDVNDIDEDGNLAVIDLYAFEYQFHPVEDINYADITGDCDVNTEDLLELLANWGPCP